MLSPFKLNGVTKKCGSKEDMVYSYCTWGFEMIFVLLTKVVAVHMRFH